MSNLTRTDIRNAYNRRRLAEKNKRTKTYICLCTGFIILFLSSIMIYILIRRVSPKNYNN